MQLSDSTYTQFYFSSASEGRVVNPGHCIEASWFLLEEALYRNDKELIDFAKTIFDISIARGWDTEYGGILYFKDVENNPVEAYEHDTLPIYATQFHPERLTGVLWDDRTPDYKPWFEYFINLVKEHSEK